MRSYQLYCSFALAAAAAVLNFYAQKEKKKLNVAVLAANASFTASAHVISVEL